MVLAYIKLILAMLIYGSLGIFRKLIDMDSTEIILLRTLIGFITLFIIKLIFNKNFNFIKIKKDLIKILLGGITMSITWILLFESYKYLDISIGVLIHYLSPVVVIMLSVILFKDPLTKNKLIGIICALLGMVLVNSNTGSSINFKLGLTYGLIAAILYGILIIINKGANNLNKLDYTMYQLFIAFLTTCIYMVYNNKGNIYIDIPNKVSLISLFIVGVIHTALACYLHFSSLEKLPVQTAALLSYVDPLSALFFSFIFLNEKLAYIQIIGALLIIIGALYGEVGNKC